MGVKHLTDLHVLVLFTCSVLASGVLYDDYIHLGTRQNLYFKKPSENKKGEGKRQLFTQQ